MMEATGGTGGDRLAASAEPERSYALLADGTTMTIRPATAGVALLGPFTPGEGRTQP